MSESLAPLLVGRAVADSTGFADWYLEASAAIEKRVLAREAEALRVQLQRDYPNDSTLWKPTPEMDSLPVEVPPPPRPSDLEWYAEHCYEGRAR